VPRPLSKIEDREIERILLMINLVGQIAVIIKHLFKNKDKKRKMLEISKLNQLQPQNQKLLLKRKRLKRNHLKNNRLPKNQR
jgi:hypothetical protein